MGKAPAKDPFDFTDLSDLPEELQKKLYSDTMENARVYADVVRKGAEAGYDELDINQIIAAATRMGIDVPTPQTVRNYLNKAVAEGMISKPSRQSYGIGKGKKTRSEDAGLTENDAVTTSDDPGVADDTGDILANIG